ncbi:LysR family transcriptional regulator [Liquorilactobacillus oeni DSM 19972]|uniref:LysR family transcriptional regulator n=2 Tax=Liquorilactobacillus oeni TaxID=303241 RepID=A0A0R1MHJ4_9LACO|nr:LysR family transcriptional regulator [Liquorilactobacillus oeni DSM 19972]
MSYTQAAQILGITQPALTQQIKKLERTVGAPLFYSVGKKLHLSDAGYTMLDATHQIYETLNEAADEIQQSTDALQGEIHLGILASIEDRIFSRFAIEYYLLHPGIKITFHMLTRKEIWERLENNEIDLAIMYLPDESIKNWKPYQSKTILTEDLLFLHNRPEYFKKKNIRLRDTTENSWVTYPPDYYLHGALLEAYKNSMIDPPSAVAYFAKPEQLFEFANSTDVYTALPASFVRAHNYTPNGKAKMHTAHFDPPIRFELSFIFRKGKDQIPRVANFLREFDDYLEKKDYDSRLTELSKQS